MSPSDPFVSVVIPAWNAEKTIQACLRALVNQKASVGNFEIIVVDDGSSDSTRQTVTSFPPVRLVCQEHSGPAVARNLGVKHAVGDIVLFTDADCVPQYDWIAKMVAPFAAENIVGVKGAYLNKQKSIVSRFVQAEYEDKYDRMEAEKFIDFIDTYSAGYRKDIFMENNGFDQSFPLASVEDQEFSFRLARLGHKLVFVRDAKVQHLGHASCLKDYFRKKFRIGYWKVFVHKRHPDKLLRDSHTPQILKIQIIIMGFGFIAFLMGIPYLITGGLIEIYVWALLLIGGVFLLTTLPFVFKTMRVDKLAALISPFILFIRAVALGMGLIAGILANFPRRVCR